MGFLLAPRPLRGGVKLRPARVVDGIDNGLGPIEHAGRTGNPVVQDHEPVAGKRSQVVLAKHFGEGQIATLEQWDGGREKERENGGQRDFHTGPFG
jgi:hypothetical protein